jgi:hypothetical protein
MGADLIVFIAKGPQKFQKRAIERTVRHAKQIQKKASKLYELLEEEEAAPEEKKGPFTEKTEKLFKDRAFSGAKCQVSIDSLSEFHEYGYLVQMAEEDIEERVKEFVEWWYSCEGRDTCGRTDPDDKRKKIVVCGDMSGGDTPDGYGYSLMDRAYWFEIPETLGVR